MRHFKFKFKKYRDRILGVGGLIAIFIFSISFFNSVNSSVLDNVSGFAWGADNWADINGNGVQDPLVEPLENMSTPGGMGWLSFNCTTGGNCGSVDYGVNINPNTGDITGYAWSSNYGWLKFGGLSDFPSGGGTTPENAKVDLTGGGPYPVTGWARFCSVAGSPATCLGPTVPNLKNGGWDGWVSLSGTSPNYGVVIANNNTFSGFAWGGNDNGKNVVGWIDFSQAVYTPIVTPTVSISANPTSVPEGGSTIISWDGLGLINSVTGCTASGGTGAWTGSLQSSPSGTFNTGVLPNGTYDYSIQCVGTDGITLSNISTVQIKVGVVTGIDFYADPIPAYPPNYQTTLFWNPNPSSYVLDNCIADSAPPLNVAVVPDWNGSVLNAPSSWSVSVPYNPTNYKITCIDQSGIPVTSTISVTRGELPESVSLSNSAVVEGPTGVYYTTLSWSTTNIVSNSCHATSSPVVSSWNNPDPKADNGSQTGVNVPASFPLYTTYTLTCTGLYSGDLIDVSLYLNEDSATTYSKKQPKYLEN